MKHRFKKAISLAVALSLTSGALAGCGGADPKEPISSSLEPSSAPEAQAMGRYLEEELSAPEGALNVASLKFLDSGELRALCMDTDYQMFVADSGDKGGSWENPQSLASLFPIDPETESVTGAAIAGNGGIFAVTAPVEYDSPDNIPFRFHYLSPEGVAKELTSDALSNMTYVFRCQFSDKNTLLLEDIGNGLLELNPESGEVLHHYEKGKRIEYSGTAGDYVMLFLDGTVHYYHLETGEPVSGMDVLTGQLSENEENLYLTNTASLPVHFCKGDTENSIFYTDRKGLHRYTEGGNAVELLIDGSLNSLSAPTVGFTELAEDENGSFYVSGMSGGETNTAKIYRYVYDENTPATPQTELKIFSMAESGFLKQAAVVFQKENPDIYLNVQVGATGDNSVTASDAQKALNTEIMAGKGPDLLLLDDMPAASYIEKGLLEDMSGIFEETELLENIKAAYTEEDGSVYRMPIRFGIPMMAGSEEDLDAVTDLKTLADLAEAHKADYGKNKQFCFSCVAPELLMRVLSGVSMPAWVKEDGTLDEAAVTEYLTQAGRIYHAAGKAGAEYLKDFGADPAELSAEYSRHNLWVSGTSLNVLSGFERIGLGGLFSVDDLADLYSISLKKPELTLSLWNGQSQNVFYPEQIIAVNAKSAQKEAAKKFVRFLFGEDGQKLGAYNGFPVNKTVYEDKSLWVSESTKPISYTSSTNNETGVSIDLEIYPASEELAMEVMALGKTLTVPANDNPLILNAVAESGARYLKGEIELEEAVSAIMQEVNLYLSE